MRPPHLPGDLLALDGGGSLVLCLEQHVHEERHDRYTAVWAGSVLGVRAQCGDVGWLPPGPLQKVRRWQRDHAG